MDNQGRPRWPFALAGEPAPAPSSADLERAKRERRSAAAAVGGRALNAKRKATRWTPTGKGL